MKVWNIVIPRSKPTSQSIMAPLPNVCEKFHLACPSGKPHWILPWFKSQAGPPTRWASVTACASDLLVCNHISKGKEKDSSIVNKRESTKLKNRIVQQIQINKTDISWHPSMYHQRNYLWTAKPVQGSLGLVGVEPWAMIKVSMKIGYSRFHSSKFFFFLFFLFILKWTYASHTKQSVCGMNKCSAGKMASWKVHWA